MTESTQSDSEKDVYPPDAQFGRAAAVDAERVDEGDSQPDLPARRRGDVRAGDKARPADEAEADDDIVDEESEESFPASDPPSNY